MTELKRLRTSKNLTQQEVADAIGVSKMAISGYESGKRIPKDGAKVALADYYGKTVAEIFFTP